MIHLFFIVGTYALFDQTPEEEMMTFFEENLKPILEGNEETYNEFVEAIKTIMPKGINNQLE